ncbi:MAG: ABC transporter ATP-binding protein [Brumimicrobium sp.]
MLKFENLHIGFKNGKNKRLLLKTSDIQFQQGNFAALIGPNGSGKTTFFNTILGLHSPLSGEMILNGKNLNDLSKKEKVKKFGFVPSKILGVNHLTTYDLIATGRAPHTNFLNRLSDNDKEIIQSIIEQLGLEELAHKNTLNLSDGERQIAMIGKALAQETDVVILDEPTAFLDYKNRRKVLSILQNITENQRKIVLLSSHDLSLCFEFCNRIIAIDNKVKKLKSYPKPFDSEEIIKEIF